MMLIGFAVRNFKSFKDGQYISFRSSKVARHKNHVAVAKGRRILKSALVFGANAGGKSNLMNAFAFSSRIAAGGVSLLDCYHKHFMPDVKMAAQPGVFEYRLLLGGFEYGYGMALSYEKGEFLGEWLFRVERNGDETFIFSRQTEDDGSCKVETDIKFKDQTEKARFEFVLDSFRGNASAYFRTRTILFDIAMRQKEGTGVYEEIKAVSHWFTHLVFIFPNTKFSQIGDINMEKLNVLLEGFDTGIEAVRSSKKVMDIDQLLRESAKDEVARIKQELSKSIDYDCPTVLRLGDRAVSLRKDKDGSFVYNDVHLDHGNPKALFDYNDESDGTKRLFDLLPLFVIPGGRISAIFIDEIDRSLHAMAVQKFLEMFYERTEGVPIQLIATTHDLTLLDLDLLRQDEIWFVERQEDRSSAIYSLDKFKERFDKKIAKEYLLGRYGAVPNFDKLR